MKINSLLEHDGLNDKQRLLALQQNLIEHIDDIVIKLGREGTDYVMYVTLAKVPELKAKISVNRDADNGAFSATVHVQGKTVLALGHPSLHYSPENKWYADFIDAELNAGVGELASESINREYQQANVRRSRNFIPWHINFLPHSAIASIGKAVRDGLKVRSILVPTDDDPIAAHIAINRFNDEVLRRGSGSDRPRSIFFTQTHEGFHCVYAEKS